MHIVNPDFSCPNCGENSVSNLLLDEDSGVITCKTCGEEYDAQ